MSSTCAKKAKLTLMASGVPYVISTPGGRVDTDRIAWKVPLDLSRRVFETDLIVLGGQGIDVILGMILMKWHKAVLDISARLVHLNSPVYGKVTTLAYDLSHQGVITSRGGEKVRRCPCGSRVPRRVSR
jgi:hypothetical protein